MKQTTFAFGVALLLIASSTTAALAASTITLGDGDSMEPTLCDNSIILVDRDATPNVSDIVLVEWRNARLTHRLTGLDGRHINVTGDNTSSLDRWNVEGSTRTYEYRDDAGAYARPLRSDVMGVTSHVLYDGCGLI